MYRFQVGSLKVECDSPAEVRHFSNARSASSANGETGNGEATPKKRRKRRKKNGVTAAVTAPNGGTRGLGLRWEKARRKAKRTGMTPREAFNSLSK